ncbi:MAG: ATP synthase F1 subunit epsilon [Planctomycetes bacterium]|nr:ATP synthase F1 subunit epsilon [Planctomycetota bacterium]
MAKTFLLEIVTPEQVLLSRPVESLVVPAAEGYLGILAGHAPLLCVLQPGEITIRDEKGTSHYCTSGGFLEATPAKVNVLTESAEPIEKIDLPRAEEARERALKRIGSGEPEVDRERARAALARADARIRLAKKRGGA